MEATTAFAWACVRWCARVGPEARVVGKAILNLQPATLRVQTILCIAAPSRWLLAPRTPALQSGHKRDSLK